MKRKNQLALTFSLKKMMELYKKQVSANTKNKRKIYKFEEFYTANITNVFNMIEDENYQVSEYNIFLIRDPKYRIIMSQKMNDKIINHVMADILIKVLEPSLIDTNVATRKNKGTHFGIKYLKKYMNELKGDTVYALKFDISKYFYSIDHEILFDLLKRKIKDKDSLDVIWKIIKSTDSDYVNRRIQFLKDKELGKIQKMNILDNHYKKVIKEIKHIPLYKKGKGLPIGNMTSQIMAIYYLNDLDHFIKEKLHIRYYIRYMDDGILLSHDKEYLKYCLKKIEEVVSMYKLKLNDKTKIINVSKEGLDFLGFRFYIWNDKIIMKVRKDTKKRFKRKMSLIKKGKVDDDKALQIINSYKGHLKWGNCYNLVRDVLKN